MVVEYLSTQFSFLLGKNIGGEIYVHLSKDYPSLLWIVTSVHTCRREAEGRKLVMAFLVEEKLTFLLFFSQDFVKGWPVTKGAHALCWLCRSQTACCGGGQHRPSLWTGVSGLYGLFYLSFLSTKAYNLSFSYYYSVRSRKQTWQIRNFNAETSELWCLKLQNIPGSILKLYDSNVCIKKKASSKNEEPRTGTVSGYPKCLLISSAALGAWIAPPQPQEA